MRILPLSADPKPFTFVQTPFNEGEGQFSPDSRWVAYSSNESGRSEVYVSAFPGRSGKWPVSIAGGSQPRWRRDGKEIFYRVPDGKLMAAAVTTTGTRFEVGALRPLFNVPPVGLFRYDVSPDGERFFVTMTPDGGSPPLMLVVNWPVALKK